MSTPVVSLVRITSPLPKPTIGPMKLVPAEASVGVLMFSTLVTLNRSAPELLKLLPKRFENSVPACASAACRAAPLVASRKPTPAVLPE